MFYLQQRKFAGLIGGNMFVYFIRIGLFNSFALIGTFGWSLCGKKRLSFHSLIRLQYVLCPDQGYGESIAHPGNNGCEVGMHPLKWQAITEHHAHTHIHLVLT